jgi:hypothetical protein
MNGAATVVASIGRRNFLLERRGIRGKIYLAFGLTVTSFDFHATVLHFVCTV